MYNKITKLVLILMLVIREVISDDKRVEEGFSLGYLSHCPGSIKEARIANKSLKHLRIAVQGSGNFMTAKKTFYNYHQMEELAANANFNKKIIMYMHGYIDHVNLPMASILVGTYKKLGYEVWLLDYSYFGIRNFLISTRFLPAVGQRVAEMLATLTKFGFNPKRFHLVGISFGGQGISFIAKNYRRITGMNISHLTSLDPTGPCFRNLGPEHRLDISDADFVEVVHSNVDIYGMAGRMGHVDFYVNGGDYQPADIPMIPCVELCSHIKTLIYWASALEHPKSFIAMQCDSVQDARDWNCYDTNPFVTNYLGEYVNKSRHGVFFLPTDYEYPYYMGEKGLKKKNNPSYKILENINIEDVLII